MATSRVVGELAFRGGAEALGRDVVPYPPGVGRAGSRWPVSTVSL